MQDVITHMNTNDLGGGSMLLLALILIPLFGALVVAFVPREQIGVHHPTSPDRGSARFGPTA